MTKSSVILDDTLNTLPKLILSSTTLDSYQQDNWKFRWLVTYEILQGSVE